MRILESERALLRLRAGPTLNLDEEILRDRFTCQLREVLEDYFFILSSEPLPGEFNEHVEKAHFRPRREGVRDRIKPEERS